MAKVYGWRYNQRGMGDWGDPSGDFPRQLPRGSKVHWEGTVTGWASGFGAPGGQQQLAQILEGAGFQVSLDYQTFWTSWNDYRIIVDAVTPVAYSSADDVFNTIKGAVWTAYQNEPRDVTGAVINTPYVDTKTGNQYYGGAPVIGSAPDTQVSNANSANRCADKYGAAWLACQTGLDSTAQQFGLGVGAGAGLLIAGLAVIGIIILKK